MEEPQNGKPVYSPFLPRPAPRVGEAGHSHLDDDPFWEQFPRVHTLFAHSVGIETPGRLPATLLVFPDAGSLKACWSDRTTSMVLFQTLDLVQPFWEQLEAFLAGHHQDWKPKKGYQKR